MNQRHFKSTWYTRNRDLRDRRFEKLWFLKHNKKIKFNFLGVIGCGYFCEERFSEEIADFIKPIVPATRILWQDTKVLYVIITLK